MSQKIFPAPVTPQNHSFLNLQSNQSTTYFNDLSKFESNIPVPKPIDLDEMSPPSRKLSNDSSPGEKDMDNLTSRTPINNDNTTTKKPSKKNKMNIADDFYFKKDRDEFLEDEELRRGVRAINGHDIYFSFPRYIYYFIVHIFYYYVLSFFVVILTPIYGKTRMKNMGFWGIHFTSLFQAFQSTFVVFALWSYIIIGSDHLHWIEIFMITIPMLLRTHMISVKYGFQSEAFMKKFDAYELTESEIWSQFILNRWKDQTEEIMLLELQSAILRLDIDTSLFFFEFIEQIDPQTRKKFRKSNNLFRRATTTASIKSKTAISSGDHSILDIEDLVADDPIKNNPSISHISSKLSTSKKKAQKRGSLPFSDIQGEKETIAQHFEQKNVKNSKYEKDKLFGYNLATSLSEYSKKYRYKHHLKTAVLFALIRALFPFFNRLFNDKPLFGTSSYDHGMIISMFIGNVFFFFVNYAILSVALLDLQQKRFLLHQLSYLISPKFPNPKYPKYFPTINIFDPISLKMWMNLRRIILNYGQRFLVRNEVNLSIYFLAYFLVTIYMILEALGVFNFIDDTFVFIVFGYETFVVSVLFLYLIIMGADLNDQFRVHKSQLKKNKSIIADLVTLRKEYFGSEKIKPNNIIYKRGVELLQEMLGEENFSSKLIEHGSELQKVYDDMIEELDFEEINNPYTIAGMTTSYNFLKGVVAFAVSMAVAVLQTKITT